MIRSWKYHMKETFISLWVNCLYDNMYIGSNKWGCLELIFFPRKPHPFVNEYHVIFMLSRWGYV